MPNWTRITLHRTGQLTIGISNAVQMGHNLALAVQDLHLVIHWYKAASVRLYIEST